MQRTYRLFCRISANAAAKVGQHTLFQMLFYRALTGMSRIIVRERGSKFGDFQNRRGLLTGGNCEKCKKTGCFRTVVSDSAAKSPKARTAAMFLWKFPAVRLLFEFCRQAE